MKLAARVEGVGLVGPGLESWSAARLTADAIDYVNLHGTATPSNDAAEDLAVHGLLGGKVPVNSTKGLTGHTLGAAGAVEAILCVLAIEEGRIPATAGTQGLDPLLRARYEIAGREAAITTAMTNSFGFGGSNCSLVLGRLRRAA